MNRRILFLAFLVFSLLAAGVRAAPESRSRLSSVLPRTSAFDADDRVIPAVFPVSIVSFRPLLKAQSAPNIEVSGNLSPNSIAKGGTVRATVVMNIPTGYHVN